jgi:hypothetical protein
MLKKFFAAMGSAFLILSVGLVMPAAALDAVNSTAASDAASSAADQAKLKLLQSRGDAEINRRLTTLNKLAGVINGDSKLSSTDKSSLTAQVNGEITDLTNLKTKLDADTTAADAQTDAQSIVSNYRVYALIAPKVYLIRGADIELTTNSQLSTLAGKLKTRLDTAQSQGKDVTSLQSTLADMNSQISSAQSLASGVETTVLPLQPTDYDSDHSVLEGQKTQLQTAHQDNQAAYNDAKTIVAGLKSL